MSEPAHKTCLVAYATPQRQFLWTVNLPADATIAQAIDEARRQAALENPPMPDTIPWDSAPVGIFGEPHSRTHIASDGDRIELYRPLQHDPKETRRERARRLRASGR
jgi:putative ubiquitin-RnfH superfamily antitoxin RatB of RatAB toxin-antitoxin module